MYDGVNQDQMIRERMLLDRKDERHDEVETMIGTIRNKRWSLID